MSSVFLVTFSGYGYFLDLISRAPRDKKEADSVNHMKTLFLGVNCYHAVHGEWPNELAQTRDFSDRGLHGFDFSYFTYE